MTAEIAIKSDQCVSDFLKKYKRHPGSVTFLKGDMGSRRFFRLIYTDHTSEILMISSSPDHIHFAPGHSQDDFVRINQQLINIGLNAPEIFAEDKDKGFLLVQDFGDLTFRDAVHHGYSEKDLFSSAVNVLKKFPDMPVQGLPDFLSSHIMKGHRRFVDWYCPAVLNSKVSDSIIESFLESWNDVLRALPAPRSGFVHVDCHTQNLMVLQNEDLSGFDTGLLDFQGAMVGPFAYDAANLLQDARLDLSADLRNYLYDKITGDFSVREKESFDLWYQALSCQFHFRVIGQFIKIACEKGDASYLSHLPRLLQYIKTNLSAYDVMWPVQKWVSDAGIKLVNPDLSDIQYIRTLIRDDAF